MEGTVEQGEIFAENKIFREEKVTAHSPAIFFTMCFSTDPV